MKKFTKVLALAFALLMVISTVSFASPHGIVENDPVSVPEGTVTIDGVIDEADGYSAPAKMNYDTCGFYWAHMPISTNADIYYAYDDEGIYVAANIVEGLEAIDERDGSDYTGMNQFNYSTGLDTIDIADDGTNQYGWDGDVVGLMFDPLGALINENFSGSTDLSAYYLIGLFEGKDGASDYTRVYRRDDNAVSGEVTEQLTSAGKVTENGWCFEIKIPWDFIIEDTDYASIGTILLEKEDILKDGALIRTNFLYQDRFFDEEQGAVATWGRYMTAPTTLQDGTPGHMGSGEGIASYGIQLNLDMAPDVVFDDVPTVDSENKQWYSEAVYYCADKGYITGTSVNPPLFNPDGKLTREQFVTILARVAGADLSKYTESKFADVEATQWYGPSVIWAAEEGYVLGIGDGTYFGVGQNMDRQQLATMFFRYAKAAGLDVEGKADLSVYTDEAAIANWSYDACAWAVNAGLIKSTSQEALILAPAMTVTRSQAAQIFMNYDKM